MDKYCDREKIVLFFNVKFSFEVRLARTERLKHVTLYECCCGAKANETTCGIDIVEIHTGNLYVMPE